MVAFPTETVYGLGAAAEQPLAVARVFEIKGRPRFDPLIVHCSHAQMAWELAVEIPEVAQRLAHRFWPGPLTLVLAKRPRIPDIVSAGLATVALRVPAHPMALELLSAFGRPIAAPSANRFGRISPTTAAHVVADLGGRVEMILDGGSCARGIESTILSLTGNRPRLLRPGAIPVELIEQEIGPVDQLQHRTQLPEAPGQLDAHYAPVTPLVLVEDPQSYPVPPGRVGLLCLTAPRSGDGYCEVEVLSPTGDLREAAARLFAALRRLDGATLDRIIAQLVPERDLGVAINDRLRRASHA